tara:strand:+ start:1077 stop:2606 length:1530 start_codon:yes stop_codon:yes gene_type:complete
MKIIQRIGTATALWTLAACTGTEAATNEPPVTDLTLEEALAGIPTYVGQHRAALPQEQLDAISRAVHRLREEIQANPDDPALLAWSAHAFALLGEDQLHRNGDDAARNHFETALMGYARSIELDPGRPRTYLAMGALFLRTDDHARAIESMDGALEAADSILADANLTPEHADARFVKDRARLWHIEIKMQLLEFDEACRSIDAFYDGREGGEWDAVFGKLEARLRGREFDSAYALLSEVIDQPPFQDDPIPYLQLALISSQRRDPRGAAEWIRRAIQSEPTPTLKPRLWRVLMTYDDYKAKARQDLREFMENAPVELTEWEQTLGRYVGAEATDQEMDFALLAAARAEHERLLPYSTETMMIVAEANLHAGLRAVERRNGTRVSGEQLGIALGRFRTALMTNPDRFRWEWELARNLYTGVSDVLGYNVKPTFRFRDGPSLELLEDSALCDAPGLMSGRIGRRRIHSCFPPTDLCGNDHLRPGDLVQCVVLDSLGRPTPIRFVVDGIRP